MLGKGSPYKGDLDSALGQISAMGLVDAFRERYYPLAARASARIQKTTRLQSHVSQACLFYFVKKKFLFVTFLISHFSFRYHVTPIRKSTPSPSSQSSTSLAQSSSWLVVWEPPLSWLLWSRSWEEKPSGPRENRFSLKTCEKIYVKTF